MKKITGLFAALLLALASVAQQGNVGIATSTPKAALNVAENRTVLFGLDTVGAGAKLVWIPSKLAFRVGGTGELPMIASGNEDGSIWDYDSIGLASVAMGFQNKAKATGSIALGIKNNAAGDLATAIGYHNDAIGDYSFASGRQNYAWALYSTAMGDGNHAFGAKSFVAGEFNQVLKSGSFAFGSSNTSDGLYSGALGANNSTKGNVSMALGSGITVNSYGACVVGLNNDSIVGGNPTMFINTDPIFIVGNGTSSVNRKNAMTVLKNGKTGFGTNTPLGLVHIRYNAAPSVPNLMLEETGNDYARISFKNANPGAWDIAGYAQQLFGDNADARFSIYYSLFGGNVFTIKGNGDANLAGTLTQNSDARLKQDITPLRHVLDKLALLSGYTYQWIDTLRGKKEQIGLLAQEVEKQFPQLVDTDEKGIKSVAYGNMVPVLLQAIKEQQIQLEELKKLIADKLK